MGERKGNKSGADTRNRIIDAALEAVRTEGLVGTSARVIARTGGFNQALVFYHFGSIDELLIAALERASERRIERFRSRIEAVETLPDLVQVAIDLQSDSADPDQPALVAIVAGWSSKTGLGPRVLDTLKPWDNLIEGALQRIFETTPLGQVIPTADLAQAISALFLGIELLNRLDEDGQRNESLLTSLAGGATFLGPFLESTSGEQKSKNSEMPK